MAISVQKIRNENEKVLDFIKKWQSKNTYKPKYQKRYNEKFNKDFNHFLNNSNLSEDTIKTFTNEK